MALSFFEGTLVTPNMICLEFRDPPLTKPAIRDATVAEKQAGGAFENYTIVSVSTGNPAVFTLDRAVPWANNTYVRISQAQGLYDINTTGYITSVSGSTFQLNVHMYNGFVLYNGAHNPAGVSYTANSAIVCQLSTGTGASRKYILGRNLDKVKEVDYFPSTRIAHETLLDIGNYAIAGKTLDFVGLSKDVIDNGLTGYTLTTNDVRDIVSLGYSIFIRATTNFANGTYSITLPSVIGLSPLSFTINDKTTRCKSFGVNQIGYKPNDESKIGTLCQYVPQYTNYGSMIFLSEFSIPNYYLIDTSGNTVWTSSGPPVLRLGNTTAETGASLDQISADPIVYGKAVTGVTVGNPTTIICPGHGLTTGDKVSVTEVRGIWLSGADNLFYQNNLTATVVDPDTITVPINTTGATAYISGGKVTKFYGANYAGAHSYLLDFSDFTGPVGTYYLYVPGFGVSDPVYIKEGAWAEVANIAFKGIYHQSMGLTKDGRFGRTHQADARVGVGGVTEILKSRLPHMLWTENLQGRVRNFPAPMRFISGTASAETWGGAMDAADWDRMPDSYHIAQFAELLGPLALVPLASRYNNANWPEAKDVIGGANYPRKFFCDAINASLWYLDFARKLQEVDGGIPSAVQFNMGSASFNERLGRQPSWETNTGWTLLAPEHASTIQYAYPAAMLAWHFKEMGHTDLHDLFLASAEAAYNYCLTVEALTHEADYHDDARLMYIEEPVTMTSANPLTFTVHPGTLTPLVNSNGTQWVASSFSGGFAAMNGTTYALRASGQNILVYDSTNTTAIDATAFGAYTSNTGKFTPTTAAFRTIWDVTATSLGYTPTNNVAIKAAAAGVLYNLTGTASYKTFHDANNTMTGFNSWGTYIYSLAAGATASEGTSMYTSMTSSADASVINSNTINDRSFSYFYNSGAMQPYGRTTQPHQQFPASCMLAHRNAYNVRRAAPFNETHEQAKAHSSVKKYIKALQDAYAFLLGSNPMKMCWAIGHGQRSPTGCANLNSEAAGTDAPAGIYPYWMIDPPGYNASNIGAGAVYLYLEAPLRDAGATTSGGVPDMTVALVPHRFARPRMTTYMPFGWMITHTEYNFGKYPHFAGIALYLQHWEGSDVQYDGKSRVFVTTV